MLSLTLKRIPRVNTILSRYKGDSTTNKYTHTVYLPQTLFSQRANSKEKEPEIQKWWRDIKLYEHVSNQSERKDLFVLHDGPPYANGDLHIGHALNKILKDFIVRYNIMRGKAVNYIPGWDCHGLPIEMKVLQSMSSEERKQLTPISLRKRAAKFANETMAKQSTMFQRYGVLGDWDSPYYTMQPKYEAAQIRVFGEMLKKGIIYRGMKPVHWSPSSKSALAEAELEYNDNHVSTSAYIQFAVKNASNKLKECLLTTNLSDLPLYLFVWTTTPWTLPANMAIAVNENIQYALVLVNKRNNEGSTTRAVYVVAEDLVSSISEDVFGVSLQDTSSDNSAVLVKVISGNDIVGTSYDHPLSCAVPNDVQSVHTVVLGGDYITASSGTGLVHTAPGHGLQDYDVGLKNGLPVIAPVDENGNFTNQALGKHDVNRSLVGLSVLGEGNDCILQLLRDRNMLIYQHSYKHKYPYDWRTKKPILMRATEQWFASVTSFLPEVLREIDRVSWVPAIGKNRILGMVKGRSDWCISRQRSWGVPIPVFYNVHTGVPLFDDMILKHLEKLFIEFGADVWWEKTVTELLPESYAHCAHEYRKGSDTMDVWFDSGSSWSGVLGGVLRGKAADLYLEGSDQHRGWFQSSLLTSVAVTGNAPYKEVLTHGFVLDGKGNKMSKSLGNVVDPAVIILGKSAGSPQKSTGKKGKSDDSSGFGADTLRLWISSVNYQEDVCISDTVISTAAENMKKFRNTFRFMLGSLNDYRPSQSLTSTVQCENFNDASVYSSTKALRLTSFDFYALQRFNGLLYELNDCYLKYDFAGIITRTSSFLSDLSAFYLDICKDRLYISKADEYRRKSCQFVLSHIVEHLSVVLGPILPHLCEDVWAHIPYSPSFITGKRDSPKNSLFSVVWKPEILDELLHSTGFTELDALSTVAQWDTIRNLRSEVNKCIEIARKEKAFTTSNDAEVDICIEFEKGTPSEGESVLVKYISGLLPVGSIGNPSKKDALFSEKHDVVCHGVDDLRFICKIANIALHSGVSVGDALSSCTYKHSEQLEVKYFVNNTATSTPVKVHIGVRKTNVGQCERCWMYCKSVGTVSNTPDLCGRCASVIRIY